MLNLSIIVPMYNVEHYIEKCLDSILEQNIPKDEYEIILLNDGSTDGTMSIAERYAEAYSEIKLFQHSNIGLSATRNRGINLAQGEYIYFMDSDDYLIPQSLSNIYKMLFHKILPSSIPSSHSYGGEDMHTITCQESCADVKSKPEIVGFKNIAGSGGAQCFDEVVDFNLQQSGKWKQYTGFEFMAQHDYLDMVWWYFIKRDYLLSLGVTFAEGKTMEDAAFTAAVLLNASSIKISDIRAYYYVYNPNSITRTQSRGRHISTMEGKICSAIRIHELMEHSAIPDAVREALIARQNGIVFDALLKIIRCCSFGQALERTDYLHQKGIYPIKGNIRGGNGLYIKMLQKAFNIRYSLAAISQAYMFIAKSQIFKSRGI